jgi:hypothetical protein
MTLDLRIEAQRVHVDLPNHPDLREAARRTWHGRMVNEYASHQVFLQLADQLEAAGLDAHTVARCRSFAEEERRHGVLCGAVTEALGGEAKAHLAEPAPFPEHAEVDRLEAALRNVLSVCCLSETIAVALIGAEREEMPEGSLRELLTSIYAEECGHANFGWRLMKELLPSVSASTLTGLSAYLSVAFLHLEQHELAHLPLDSRPPAHGRELGLCAGSDARTLFYATVETVIVPGLQAMRLDAQLAWQDRHAGAGPHIRTT